MVFTLDDAYIHLALAENIMQGHYGINLNEYSAPASSILWPFLIAPFARLTFANYIILLANTAFAIITLFFFWKILLPDTNDTSEKNEGKQTILSTMLILLIPACNLIGLVFTGMEHSLQVMLAVAVICGLSRESENSRLDWWLMPAILLAPLVRYECLAISVPAAIYLFLRGHRKAAVTTAVGLLFALTGFSLFLLSLGQNSLPNSVAAKSKIVSEQKTSSIIQNFVNSIESPRGVLLAVCLLFLVLQASNRKNSTRKRLFCATISASIILHLLFGQFGWFSRYEIYIWAMTLAAIGFIFKPDIYNHPNNFKIHETTLLLFASTFLLCFPYLMTIPVIPVASRNIYEQHYQMHRFVTEFYKKPVAANDIGYISYQNPAYILDLVGLASLEALTLRVKADQKDWMDSLAKAKGVELAMIYDDWFDNIPDNWYKLGELQLKKAHINILRDKVAFYAIKRESYDEIYNLLEKFALTLPEGVDFEFVTNKTTTNSHNLKNNISR